jgi:hypothetical protein
MAKNLFGGTNTKNFARGEPPPVGSWEYAGIAGMGKKAPSSAPAPQKKIPVIIATSETVMVVEKKPKKWKYLGIGAAVGAVATYLGLKIRSF